jgi:hypothetical protein
MIQIWLLESLALLIPLYLGWQLVVLLERKSQRYFPKLLKLSLAFGLGIGVVSWLMFINSLISKQFCLGGITLIVIMLGLLISLINRRLSKQPGHKLSYEFIPIYLSGKLYNWMKWLFIIFIMIQCIYVFGETMITPFVHWDSWAIWGLKGRIFYTEHSTPLSYFQLHSREFGAPDYPLLVPLSETWLALWLNTWNEPAVKLLSPLFYSSLLLLCYYFIRSRERNNSFYPWLFTFFLATIPQLASNATLVLANIPLIYYSFGSFIFLFWWVETKQLGFLIYASLFAGLGMWTKNEGLPLFLITGIVLFYFSWKKHFAQGSRLKNISWLLSLYVIPAVGIFLPWLLFKHMLNVQNQYISWNRLSYPEVYLHLSQLPTMFTIIGREMFIWERWNILWIALIPLFVLYWIKRKHSVKIQINAALTYIILYLVTLMGVFMVYPASVVYCMRAIHRQLLHIVPEMVVLIYLLTITPDREIS